MSKRESYIHGLLKGYGDELSLAEFTRISHISPCTAQYLIKSKLVPSYRWGKDGHFINIKKRDVQHYLEYRLVNPGYYQKPAKNSESKYVKPPWVYREHMAIDFDFIPRRFVRKYYKTELKFYADAMSTYDLVAITGYSHHTVQRWINEGRIEALALPHGYMIPKEYLLDYLESDHYNSIPRKSRIHLKHIEGCFNAYVMDSEY